MESAGTPVMRVAAAFEAMLLRPLFAPLERACGPLGEVASQAWAEAAAQRGDDAFGEMLRRSLERDDG
ncbi:MAG: hypothetical protein KGM44_08790 [bacterium]|nr:hypothetical protein [bacterium]